MTDILYMADAVVTGDELQRKHQGEGEVRFAPRTVVTPTAWDYIREKDLRVSRGEAPEPASVPAEGDPPSGEAQERASALSAGEARAEPQIKEVPPPQMTQEGRCDHPDQPYGCKTDEFGSGFVDGGGDGPPVPERDELEELIQQITDLVMEQLGRVPES